VTVHEDKRHSYQEGDFVKFQEVEGMTQINNAEPFEITQVKGPFSFKIKADSRAWGAYTRQGQVEDIKVPKVQAYHSLAKSVLNPTASTKFGMLETPDLRQFGRSEQLHVAFRAVHAFHSEHKRYPGSADVPKVLELAKALNEKAKAEEQHFVEELDEKVVEQTASYAAFSISPMAAFFGGILAQECVKLTGKYSPLQQWLHFDMFSALPTGEVDRSPEGTRYDDQV